MWGVPVDLDLWVYGSMDLCYGSKNYVKIQMHKVLLVAQAASSESSRLPHQSLLLDSDEVAWAAAVLLVAHIAHIIAHMTDITQYMTARPATLANMTTLGDGDLVDTMK